MSEVNKVIVVGKDGEIESHDRNQRLYISATLLMEASKEMAPMSAEFAKIFYDLGDVLLSEMTVNDKMTKEEMNKVMKDILNG